jgi:glycosyltransferase involved in cell wall biosynthesis
MLRGGASIQLGWSTGAAVDTNKISAETTTIVVPTFNQAMRIGPLLERLHAAFPKTHVLVADNCSRDGTQAIVSRYVKQKRALVDLIERRACDNYSLTAAFLDAFDHCGTAALLLLPPQFERPQTVISSLVHVLESGVDVAVPAAASFRSAKLPERVLRYLAQRRLNSLGIQVSDPFSLAFAVNLSTTRSAIKILRELNVKDDLPLFHLLRHLGPEGKIAELDLKETLTCAAQFGPNQVQWRDVVKALLK